MLNNSNSQVISVIVEYIIATVFKLKASDQSIFSLSLAQAGEFGFVLIAFAVQIYVIDND